MNRVCLTVTAVVCAGFARIATGANAVSTGDDTYRFASGASQELPATLAKSADGVTLTWPATPQPWDTALLGVRVRADQGDPWVELGAGKVRFKQYLDPGARGLRWLNLTGLRGQLTPGSVIAIGAHAAAVDPGPASLRLFANKLPLEGRILILAPHPDDAEIAAFGLYAGRNATIVTVTAGNAGDANYAADFPNQAEQYQWKGYLRTVDSVTVPWQGQIPPERCFNLGYFDGRLQQMHDRPTTTMPEVYGPNTDVGVYRRANIGHLLPTGARGNSWAHLVEDLAAVLNKVKPALLVMPHPFLDDHSDHEFVTVAALEALARWKQPVKFLLYTNHAVQNLFPFGPAGTVTSLPPWSGPEIPVQSVYAHPVTPELQRRKLYALETMHDVRLSPSEQNGCLPPGTPPKREDYPRLPAVDFLRRAPRPQEIFIVVDRVGLRDLVQSFLAQIKPAR